MTTPKTLREDSPTDSHPISIWNYQDSTPADTDAINFTTGFPDFSPPKHVSSAFKSLVNNENNNSLIHQYTKQTGHPRLANIVAKLYGTELKRDLNPERNVLVTAGAVHGLFCCIFSLVRPGDEVIIFQPAFKGFSYIVNSCGGVPVYVKLNIVEDDKCKNDTPVTTSDANQKLNDRDLHTTRFEFDEEELKSKFSAKTKLIIVNTPHNPLAKVFTTDELSKISQLCTKHDVLCISDEVYERMVQEPLKHVSIASLPGMWERTLKICSAGKLLSVTGWKLGWCIGPDDLIRKAVTMHIASVHRIATPLQEAVAIALEGEYTGREDPNSYFNSLPREISTKVDQVCEIFLKLGLKPLKPEGSYYVVVNVSNFDFPVKDSSQTKDFQFANWLLNEMKIAVLPVTMFYDIEDRNEINESLVRICCFKRYETIDRARRIIEDWSDTK
ncbi:hypothetical protein HELRODRAFT_188198 [Helobdella robusta]|uniref:kynurenine--oxoglutarate transaminase n=1 Tax=Helobdella robusta TaxID=6412 RepID=T1FPR7_HELRO|nr:hypothetical protein HELRODRAFT_188198 [Helobdella robusta]ESO05852.1 hypothetical protein HELRODRAFT_188198 [Helobdella robusta]